MRKLGFLILSVIAACADAPKPDAKGDVDDSLPPTTPTQLGKADSASSKVLPINVQSAHPYTNNLSKTYPVTLTGMPACANGARLHFKTFATEAGYDFVTVTPGGEQLDGTHNDTWSQWFNANQLTAVSVKLTSDYSVTKDGFTIDSYEWRGAPICPAIAWPACGTGTVDIQKIPGTCQCPQQPVCATLADVEVSHRLSRGFNNTNEAVHGSVATYTHPGPTDAPVTDTIGSIDTQRLADLVHKAGQLGLLQGAGYTHTVPSTGTTEVFSLKAATFTVEFTAAQGAQDAAVQSLIDDFEALFTCGGGTGGLTCGSGFECNTDGDCTPAQSCVCTAIYSPVCGVNGHTYSNACNAGCAQAPVAHTGECGIAGDTCGTLFGLSCQANFKCRFKASTYEYPFPDAGGKCVDGDYCDAASDCATLGHPGVYGAWTCQTNKCVYVAGPQWQSIPDGHFETAHPYANSTSTWKQLYAPAGATSLRLRVSSFNLENGYDFLEVWNWNGTAWALAKRFTGTTAPALTEEFAGQYHYLKFVSDPSVTASGVTLDAEYR